MEVLRAFTSDVSEGIRNDRKIEKSCRTVLVGCYLFVFFLGGILYTNNLDKL